MSKQIGKLPGEDLVKQGLHDLSQNIFSSSALLVLIGAPRLRRMGIQIPFQKNSPSHPEHFLYEQIQKLNPKNAHSHYNALIRKLVSYERALEQNHGLLS